MITDMESRDLGRRGKVKRKSLVRGFAILTVLFFVSAISLLIVTFLSASRFDQISSHNYGESLRAEQIGQGAVNLLLRNLSQEIVAGSTRVGTGNYRPTGPASVLPAGIGTIPSIPNLIQRSVATDGEYTSSFPTTLYDDQELPAFVGSPVSSGEPSRQGRRITAERWNRPRLGEFSSTDPLPNWVLVTRQGAQAFTAYDQAMADRSSDDFVLGRFAYAMYDVSGLLNLNVAGYDPDHRSSLLDELTSKHSIAYADLTEIGLSNQQVKDLVQWRNAKNAGSAASYQSFTKTDGPDHGFSRIDGDAVAADNRFFSRQDLIQYADANGFSDATLQKLTHFHRESETPSHQFSAALAAANTPDLLSIDIAGEPLRKFPLERLALLEIPDPSAQDLALIRDYFGLAPGPNFSPNVRHWVYTASQATADGNIPIKSISTVASEQRQPNLFEVLLTGIAENSLGKSGYDATTGNFFIKDLSVQSNTHMQVARIAAAMIDQADADDYPTIISIGEDPDERIQVYGVENLPYFNEMFVKLWPKGTDIETYVFFELWNPHRNAASSPNIGDLRIKVNATASCAISYDSIWPAPIRSNFASTGISSFEIGPPTDYVQPKVVYNPSAPNTYRFGTPRLEFTGWQIAMIPETLVTSHAQVGFWGAVFQLQYKVGTEWQTYSTFGGVLYEEGTPLTSSGFNNPGPYYHKTYIRNTPGSANTDLLSKPRFDPRSTRFGAPSGQMYWRSFSPINASLAPSGLERSANTHDINSHKPTFLATLPGWFPSYPAYLWNNRGSQSKVADGDNIFRPGDGYLTGPMDTPLRAGADPIVRPTILNRPFRSVGELGHVFRDQPWKTLDLFSADSADARLLDLFTVYEQTQGESRQDTVSLNTPHPEVLASLLKGTARDPQRSAFTMLNENQSRGIAQDIVARTRSETDPVPFLNIADLVTSFPAYGGESPTLSSTLPTVNLNYEAAKVSRESIPRALASTTGTRTWNLLIDVIAQSGRYPQGSDELSEFLVEGERRYWLHVAIDRYSGEVVDSQLEVVYE